MSKQLTLDWDDVHDTHTHSYTYHSYAHTLLYTHTHTTRAQSYSHTQGTKSPIYFGRLRPRSPRQESSEDDGEIVLSNRRLSPDKNEDTDGTDDGDETDSTMSAGGESDDAASPPDVESQVLDFPKRPKRRRHSSSGAFASSAGAEQQPEPTLNTSPAPSRTERRVRNRPNARATAMMEAFGDEVKGWTTSFQY